MIMGIERWGNSDNTSIFWGILTSEETPYGNIVVTAQIDNNIKDVNLKDITVSKNKLVGRMDLKDIDPSSDEDTDIQDAFELNFSVQKISYGEFLENSKQLNDTGIDSEYQSQLYESIQDNNDSSKAGLYKSGFKCDIIPAFKLPSAFSPKQTSNEEFNKIIASNDVANCGLIYLVDGKIKIVWANPKRTYAETYNVKDFYELGNVALLPTIYNSSDVAVVDEEEQVDDLSSVCIRGLLEPIVPLPHEAYSSLDASIKTVKSSTKIVSKDISDLIYYTLEDLKGINIK